MKKNITNNHNPIEILLIEDNEADVVLTKRAFLKGKINNNVQVAYDGLQAFSMLRNEGEYENNPKPHVILLDINLPKLSGHDVLKELKTDADLKRIPVIMLTSSEADIDIFKSYEFSASSYIVKPVDADKFKAVVSAIEDFWFSVVVLPTHVKEG